MASGIIKKIEGLGRKSHLLARMIAQAEYWVLPATKEFNKKVEDLLDTYVEEERRKNRRTVRKIKKDLLYSQIVYQISAAQYFILRFENLTDRGRREYVGEREKQSYTIEMARKNNTHDLFRNKYETYKLFRDFYHRDVVRIDAEHKDEFLHFVAAHPRFILKHVDDALGKGVSIVDTAASGETAEQLFDRLIKDEWEYIAEELIVQAPELMAIHPSSVNTVRFATFLKGDEIQHLFSFLRMGSGNGIIDNATAGGLAAAIDMETGIVTSPACREDLTRMLCHPDTGVQIIGMQIPRWDELLTMVDALARMVPAQQFVGWDLALTEKGWVMVEGNDNAMITAIQMCEQKGLREVFDRAFKS